MDEFASKIEALEHRWMRAWIGRDKAEMKMLSSGDLVVLFGAERPALLDRASWLAATEERLRCRSYKFGSVYLRRHGKFAVFIAPVDLDVTIDREQILTKGLLTSIWKRTAVKRRWRLIECCFAGQTGYAGLPGAIRSMQLWR
ncbi:nuclear transport factor 2 family protein [Altererythrobacter sp. SALINAS58]|uniref:nuclear transport factor 2 family protein n=1 Tax=Alteripontixanthobacter muriae TaxID=2705546 RepID=UPI0015773B0F|nr:nuclear transport factor 2 family protein [Alteripontixanthobacter muriae]